MWRQTVLICALLTGILAGRASAQTPVLFGFVDITLRLAVRQAAEGAAVRLARPGCQEVLSDFTDQSGQSLSTKLKASGTSPSDALSLLRFFDDRWAPQCRSAQMFTQTGSPLIRVCAGQFSEGFRRNQTMTEIIIIHELLHTLGLGENPPTSAAITEQVVVRCGG